MTNKILNVTEASMFNLETGILDPTKHTFRVIEIRNYLADTTVEYYLS